MNNKRKIILCVIGFAAVVVLGVAVGMTQSFDQSSQERSFFYQFIIAGGPIVWCVLIPMSLAGTYLIVFYGMMIKRTRLLPDFMAKKIVTIINRAGLAHAVQCLEDNEDLLSVAFVDSVKQRSVDKFRLRGAFIESLQDQAQAMLRKIEWLNLIGNVAPMVGLLGTVFGMIKLFNAIVVSGGQPQPALLAGGISIALVTTFWGLFTAIPAIAIYNIFQNKIEEITGQAAASVDVIMAHVTAISKTPTVKTKSTKTKLKKGLDIVSTSKKSKAKSESITEQI